MVKMVPTRVPVDTCGYLWWGWKHGYVNSESCLIMEQISKVSTPWASSLRVLSSWYFFHLRFLLHVIAVVDAVVQVLQEFLLIQFRDNPNTECSVTPLLLSTFNSHRRSICPCIPIVCMCHSCCHMLASLIAALHYIFQYFAAGCFTNGPRQSARREVAAHDNRDLNLSSLQLLSILLDFYWIVFSRFQSSRCSWFCAIRGGYLSLARVDASYLQLQP